MDSGSGIAICISSILPIDAIIVLVMGQTYLLSVQVHEGKVEVHTPV